MVVEVDRAAVEEKQVDGLAAHGREARVRRGRERGDRRQDVRADDDRGHAPRSAAQANRIVPDVERVAAPPEQRGDRPRQDGLLDVEPLQQVECTEQEQEDERRSERPFATAREVEGGHDQRRAGGKCKRVEDGHGLHRFEVEQQVAAPADVWRQRRADIDDARDRSGCCGQSRQPVAPAHVAELGDALVQKRAPRGGVAARGEEVVPVLDHEPRGERPDQRRARIVDHVRESERGCQTPGGGAELPLVDPSPEYAHARAELMAFEADHVSGFWAARGAPTVASIGGRQAAH